MIQIRFTVMLARDSDPCTQRNSNRKRNVEYKSNDNIAEATFNFNKMKTHTHTNTDIGTTNRHAKNPNEIEWKMRHRLFA